MKVKLKSITPNAEINIVEIARVSSSREDKTSQPEKLINYLLENKHFSPFQHSYITFEIVTSKAIGIQLLRHLSFTFQEFSQRYAKVEKIESIEFRLQAEKNRQSSTDVVGIINQNENRFEVNIDQFFEYHNADENAIGGYAYVSWINRVANHLEQTLLLYNEGLELGIAKECARMILPMTTQTTIYMTGSTRSWIHFLQIRDEDNAQKEVRLVAKEIKKNLIFELPIISKALNWEV